MDQSLGLLPVAKRDFFTLFWDGWVNSFKEHLILKAFEATGISPQNANVILKRFTNNNLEPGSSSSDNSESSLSNWIKIQRRLKNKTSFFTIKTKAYKQLYR
ncbi:hypothetical protein EJ02DRAFT_420922 [Clathrospora elynae]|uniref:Uncharacterized protein n=1 Tax=Clathrospora elynae TaxID=706981 RepID=A0A6A5SUN6_9PLEO|nr:hypothetical protein EJ02DRAFT_420922 [Clathrospora elynae]